MTQREETVIYACCAVEDLPEPYVTSERGKTCSGCGREVWWDPRAWAAAEVAARDQGSYQIQPTCQRCMDRWMKAIVEEHSG
jgi:hypothetical protein